MVGRVAFSPDGKLIASSGNQDQRAILWDVATGWQVGEFRNEEANNRVRDVAFSPDGRSLAITSDLHTKIWDLATRQARLSLPGHVVAFRPDGKLLALGCGDSLVRLGAVGSEPPRGKTLSLFPKGMTIIKVAFTPEGRYLATADQDRTVYVLRLAERSEVYEVPPPMVELQPKTTLPAHEGAVTLTAFSGDGKSLSSAGKDGVLKLWSAADGKERWHLTAHDGGVRVLAMTGDGKTLATAGFDGVIRLWDAGGKKLHELPGHKGGVAPLLFTANGEELLSGGADGCVRFWSVRDGKEVNKIDASKDWITHLSLTPDGKTLATSGNDGSARLWNVETGKESTTLPQRSSVCFSPDGKRLAVATPNHQIKLLDADTLEVRAVLIGHTETPDGISFSADGKLLASCSADRSIRVWDARRGHLLALARGYKGRVWTVVLTADGTTLAAGDEDGKLLLWDAFHLSQRR
jgi:WD40 repeat protein